MTWWQYTYSPCLDCSNITGLLTVLKPLFFSLVFQCTNNVIWPRSLIKLPSRLKYKKSSLLKGEQHARKNCTIVLCTGVLPRPTQKDIWDCNYHKCQKGCFSFSQIQSNILPGQFVSGYYVQLNSPYLHFYVELTQSWITIRMDPNKTMVCGRRLDQETLLQ